MITNPNPSPNEPGKGRPTNDQILELCEAYNVSLQARIIILTAIDEYADDAGEEFLTTERLDGIVFAFSHVEAWAHKTIYGHGRYRDWVTLLADQLGGINP